jgi:hypothetical protein
MLCEFRIRDGDKLGIILEKSDIRRGEGSKDDGDAGMEATTETGDEFGV